MNSYQQLRTRVRDAIGGDKLAQRLYSGAFRSVLTGVVGTALSFATQILLARTLGAPEYGVYAYALSWTHWLILLGRLEYDTAAIRFIGQYDGQLDHGRIQGFIRHAQRVVVSASIAVSLGGAAVTIALRDRLDGSLERSMLVVWLLLPLTALLMLNGNILQGFKEVLRAQLPSAVLRPALLAIGLLAWWLAGPHRATSTEALLINAGATAIALIVAILLVRQRRRQLDPGAVPIDDRPAWWRASRSLLVVSGSQFILSQQADVLVVGSLLSPLEAGFYGAAGQLSMLVGFAANSSLFIALPMIAELHGRGDKAGLQRLVTLFVRLGAALALPALAFIVIFGHKLLEWYGRPFVAGYPVLIILSVVAVVFSSFGGLSGFMLTMTGNERTAARIAVVSSVLNLGMGLLLTKKFGAIGAASATAFVGALRCGWLVAIIRRELGIDMLSLRQPGSFLPETPT